MILGIQLLVVHKVSKAYDTTMLMGLPTMNGRLANAVAMEKGREKKMEEEFPGSKKGEKARKNGEKAEKGCFRKKG